MEKAKSNSVVSIVAAVVVPLLLGSGGWTARQTWVNSSDIVTMKERQVTKADLAELAKGIMEVQKQVAALPTSFPPKDYRDMVDMRLRSVENLLAANNQELMKLTAEMAGISRQQSTPRKP